MAFNQENGRESGNGGRGGPRRQGKFVRFGARSKRKVEPEEPLEYKNIAFLAKFVSPQGKIQSRKRTNFSGQHQRMLAQAIKHARFLALMPYVGKG